MINQISQFNLPTALYDEVNKKLTDFLNRCAELQFEISHEQQQCFVNLFTCSHFAYEYCCKDPQLILTYLNDKSFHLNYKKNIYYQRLSQLVTPYATETELLKIFRNFRNLELFRILWRDINQTSTLATTLLETSYLADVCIDTAAKIIYEKLQKQYGVPCNDKNEPQEFLIIAVGKLGMQELNFSSDVDLIYCFSTNGVTSGEKTISNERFFTLLSQRLTKMINSITADGFVFRIDLRLRPFGSQGALVYSLDGLQNYYRDHGRDWERFALAKARIISGEKYAEQLQNIIKDFVYKSYLDYSATETLKRMGALWQRQGKNLKNDIKRGSGGIREIEFIVQLYQIIHGGKEIWLQNTSLLLLLREMIEKRVIAKNLGERLFSSYNFLRALENRLQQVNDMQTQQLPDQDLEKTRISFGMKFNSWEELEEHLTQTRNFIHDEFESTIQLPVGHREIHFFCADDPIRKILFDPNRTNQEFEQQLNQLGYKNEEQIKIILSFFQQQKPQISDKIIQNVILKTLTLLSNHPHITEQLKLFFRLFEILLQRDDAFEMLDENPHVLMKLGELFSKSKFIAEEIIAHPFLLNELLDNKLLYAPYSENKLDDELRQALLAIPENNLEEQIDCLRSFKLVQILRVAAADLAGTMPLMKVSDHLTFTATVIVRHAKTIAWQALTAAHGHPMHEDGYRLSPPDFLVVAYGKLGGLELSYGSDLDLVFLSANINATLNTDGLKAITNNEFFVRLAQRLIHILSSSVSGGVLYHVDTRLRPSGQAGLLVNSLSAFERYQIMHAWTWEHQALVRARVISGSQQLTQQFDYIRAKILSQKRDIEKLKQDIRTMREKMLQNSVKSENDSIDIKQDMGGIETIEFIAQFFVLGYGHDYPSLYEYSDTIRILEAVVREKLLSENAAERLSQIYRKYREVVHHASLQNRSGTIQSQQFCDEREFVKELWGKLLT